MGKCKRFKYYTCMCELMTQCLNLTCAHQYKFTNILSTILTAKSNFNMIFNNHNNIHPNYNINNKVK